jgi:hypothetical protein|tara:strand:+ start:319 stop:723 length:405 start_codon:yes stop_codon:yes gene_type:complete
MARTRKTPIGRFGGVRIAQRRIKTSETLEQNKEAVATELIALGTTKITDIMNLDGTMRDEKDIPDEALRAIKKITPMPDGRIAVELHDKVAVLRILAKAAGFLDSAEKESDKPSIVGINMKGPVIDAEPVEDSK